MMIADMGFQLLIGKLGITHNNYQNRYSNTKVGKIVEKIAEYKSGKKCKNFWKAMIVIFDYFFGFCRLSRP